MSEKHLHMARRKMSHVIDELYTALLRCGGECVELTIRREEEGLRLLVRGDFSQEHQRDIQGMADILQPKVRNSALVQEFWELAGGDQYTSDSELALVGQMVDEARVQVGESQVALELFVRF